MQTLIPPHSPFSILHSLSPPHQTMEKKKKTNKNYSSSSADSGHHSDSESTASTRIVTPTPKLKSYSQPLNKKQFSLDADKTNAAAAAGSNARSYSCPHSTRHDLHAEGPTAPANGSLPEFIGAGGNAGIFKLPLRAAMHPGRPPPLDLRPHPLRETQTTTSLRTVAFSSRPPRLWAGHECGVRFWDLDCLFDPRKKGARRRGDEMAAPFRESVWTPPAVCLTVDEGRGVVWSGHRDGRIRGWAVGTEAAAEEEEFDEGLSWQAHRGPVISLAITCYGELWSGFEGGVIKVWPWEAIDMSLSSSAAAAAEEKHVASCLLIERSSVDLRSLATVDGACSLPSAEVKYMLPDNSRSKVWSGSSLSFALWDSRKKELLKVFGINGHVEAHVDASPVQDHGGGEEDEMKVKLVAAGNPKKEKSQGSGNFLQRSRNALLGAADAVRRAAAKGSGDDGRRTEAVAVAADGVVWSGCTNGSLYQWDGSGGRVQEVQHRASPVQCVCAFGERVWVGYESGWVQVLDLEGNLLGGWPAHSAAVAGMAVGGPYVFTMASHGGVRGWYLTSPGPLDGFLRAELDSKEQLYTKVERFRILAGTWNVGQERASRDSLALWLASAASEVSVVVVGLQEVEMGAGFLAVSAAKESVGLEGSTYGNWWLDAIGKSLDEGMLFERVGSRQLAGLLIAVWARKNLTPYIGDVDAAAVPCGLGRAIGNKGAVGLRMRVYDRIMCFVNCHFAAHLEAVNKRNADFDHVYKTMTFSRANTPTGGASSNRAANVSDSGKPELSEADMIVFLGDFNYRLRGISYDEARDLVSQRCFDWLREKDQLRAEMKAGKVFQGLREAHFKFPPTYKFERDQAGLSGYDCGEKKRIPAWCDRILYRDNRSVSLSECSSECPIVCSISQYDACLDVTGSDHKPVRCILRVDVAHVNELTRRLQFGEILASNKKVRSLLDQFRKVPEMAVSTSDVVLANQDASVLKLTNKNRKDNGVFEIICEGPPVFKEEGHPSRIRARGPFGFPNWLKVSPSAGMIKPGQTIEISMRHEDSRTLEDLIDGMSNNWLAEDPRDKEVTLTVNVTGCWSTDVRGYRVRVHRSSSKGKESNSSLMKSQSKRH